MKKAGFSNRALVSLLSLWGFVIMAVTGIVLYIVPQGRIAYWVEWKFLGLTKEQWGSIHVLGMFLFLVTMAFHLYFNWKPLMGYFKSRVTRKVGARWELLVSSVVALFFILSGITEIKPLGYLLDVEAMTKDSWVKSPKDEPPFGHAELVKFKVLCKKSNIPVDKALKALADAGVKGATADRVFLDIARENDMSPRDLFLLIEPLEESPALSAAEKGQSFTEESIEETFAGSGVGRKTIAELAAQVGRSPKQLVEGLTKKGLSFDEGDSLKQIAQKNGYDTPLDVLKAMLLD